MLARFFWGVPIALILLTVQSANAQSFSDFVAVALGDDFENFVYTNDNGERFFKVGIGAGKDLVLVTLEINLESETCELSIIRNSDSGKTISQISDEGCNGTIDKNLFGPVNAESPDEFYIRIAQKLVLFAQSVYSEAETIEVTKSKELFLAEADYVSQDFRTFHSQANISGALEYLYLSRGNLSSQSLIVQIGEESVVLGMGYASPLGEEAETCAYSRGYFPLSETQRFLPANLIDALVPSLSDGQVGHDGFEIVYIDRMCNGIIDILAGYTYSGEIKSFDGEGMPKNLSENIIEREFLKPISNAGELIGSLMGASLPSTAEIGPQYEITGTYHVQGVLDGSPYTGQVKISKIGETAYSFKWTFPLTSYSASGNLKSNNKIFLSLSSNSDAIEYEISDEGVLEGRLISGRGGEILTRLE